MKIQPVVRPVVVALYAACLLFVFSISSFAATVRVATYNVEHGIAPAGTEKGDAQRAILRRINADVIAFEELEGKSSNEWAKVASELGYPHCLWGELGPYAGSLVVGVFSRFPVLESGSVKGPEGSSEFSRVPLRVTVEVPGAAQPLTLWAMHHKALFRPVDEFRRAVEAIRLAEDVRRFSADHPDRTAFLILGDMNDDLLRDHDPQQSPQSERFTEPPSGLPKSYKLGPGVSFPLAYRPFPLTAYEKAGPGFQAVPAFREGGTNLITHLYTQYRLDYIFASSGLTGQPDHPPKAEIYYSELDAGGGLPKRGEPLSPGLSIAASDHYPVFADFWLQDKEPDKPATPEGHSK